MIFQHLRGPDPELGAALRLDPVAHRNYDVEVVKINQPLY